MYVPAATLVEPSGLVLDRLAAGTAIEPPETRVPDGDPFTHW